MKVTLSTESIHLELEDVASIRRGQYKMYDTETAEVYEYIDCELELIFQFTDRYKSQSFVVGDIDTSDSCWRDEGTTMTIHLEPDGRSDNFYITIEGGVKEDLDCIREYFELRTTHEKLLDEYEST